MSGRGTLTRRDFDEVMRRASELAAAEPGGSEGEFTEAELVRIGREVGLADRHVRRALREFHSGTGQVVAGRRGIRALLESGEVRAGRTVARPRERIRHELDDFMVGGQLLQRVRQREDLLQYRPAIDWASRVARAASSTSRQHYVAASRLVEVRLEDLGTDSTQVDIVVDPGMAGNYRTGAVLGGGMAGAAAGLGVGAGLALLASLPVAALGGVAVGLAAAALVASMVAQGFQRRLGEVHLEVEGILDGLEDDGGLEPPPPAWRRWVRRHFHGVAREMMGKDDY